MMVQAKKCDARPGTARPGTAMVEMAFVCIVFLMLLFGMIEYCRLLFVKQLLTTAAREGARYAVTHTQENTVVTATQNRVKGILGGMDKNLKGYDCKVYKADSSGNSAGLPQDAQFGQWIGVEVSCDYDPILPSFLFMDKTFKVKSKSLMYSEAN